MTASTEAAADEDYETAAEEEPGTEAGEESAAVPEENAGSGDTSAGEREEASDHVEEKDPGLGEGRTEETAAEEETDAEKKTAGQEELPPADGWQETEAPENSGETEGSTEEEFEDITIELEDMFADTDDISTPSEEELLEGYVESVMYSKDVPDTRKKLYRISAGSRLRGMNRGVYEILSRETALIAEGQRSSTQITFTVDELGLEKTSWTAQELGIDAIVVNGAIPNQVIRKVQDEVGYDFDLVIGTLLEDNPYTLYWFNKTGGVRSSGYSLRTKRGQNGETEIEITGSMTVSLPVAEEYAVSTYEIDTSCGTSIQTAKENAAQVVSGAAGLTDYEKLDRYREEICEMTSYNWDAVNSSLAYGNPWQLIWVFDGDRSTKVVCEGYSKAFKYLCDMTEFDSGDISCIIAVGEMTVDGSGGGHMWNIVRMDDGGNYLVDVTNCDSSSGYPDTLFLTGPEEDDETSNIQDGYTILGNNGKRILYDYFSDMYSMYEDGEIELEHGKYRPEVPKREITIGDISLNSTVFIYTGEPQLPSFSVAIDGNLLEEGTDYTAELPKDRTDAGIKTITVTGTGNFAGSVGIEYEILPADISNAQVEPEAKEYTETGDEIRPSVSVSSGGKTLEEGKDYEVSYKDNILPGEASAVITGMGNYEGEKEVPFTIREKEKTFTIVIEDGTGSGSEGAVYGIYLDASCLQEKSRVTIGADGTAQAEGYAAGTWYIKEIAPPFGFEKNAETYSISISPSGEDTHRTVTVKETEASEENFVTEGKTTFYICKNGEKATGFIEADGYTYYFNASGAMVKSRWITENGKTYFFGADGRAYEGFRTINGKEFFFDARGARKTGFARDGEGNLYFMQTSGALRNSWKTIGVSTYYFGEDGRAVSGQAVIGGVAYVFDDDCALMEGLVHTDSGTYFVGSGGKVIKNVFRTINGYTYFFGIDGKAYTGLRTIAGKVFFFDEQGRRKLGLVSDGNGVYYMLASGMAKDTWKTVSGKKYYFGGDGKARTGLAQIEGGIYFFADSGAMVKNRWVPAGGAIYFFGSDGKAYTGLRMINNKPFWFTEDGKLTSL